MGTLDSREYDQLKKREFRPYSFGHRMMYEIPLKEMKGRKWTVYEAGFGIGWGLDRMIEEDVLNRYVGCEPNLDSFNYVKSRHGERRNVALDHAPFRAVTMTPPFDHVFCIEVIEHVPMEAHLEFLRGLRKMGMLLWFSTPDSSKSKEGVRRASEWSDLLSQAGFTSVQIDKSHWTYLFKCE